MELAAFASFLVLVVAWIVVPPSRFSRTKTPAATPERPFRTQPIEA